MGRDRPPCPEVLPSPCVSGPTLTDLGAALRREAPAHGAVGARPAGAPSLHVLPPGPPEKAGKGRASLQYMRRDEGGRRGEEGGARGRTERRDPDAGAAPELRVQPTLKGGLGGSASGALEGGRTGAPWAEGVLGLSRMGTHGAGVGSRRQIRDSGSQAQWGSRARTQSMQLSYTLQLARGTLTTPPEKPANTAPWKRDGVSRAPACLPRTQRPRPTASGGPSAPGWGPAAG